MLLLIIIGIIAYAAGDHYFNLFKIAVGAAFIVEVGKLLIKDAPARRARRNARRNNRAVRKAQKELKRSLAEMRAATKQASVAVAQCKVAEDYHVTHTTSTRPVQPTEYADPYDIDFKELSIEQLQKRLNALYSRMDKLKYQHGYSPEAWEKYKKTATYRGIDWDITDTEQRLARAIENEKRRWANA